MNHPRGDMKIFSENFLAEDTNISRARGRGIEIGCDNTSPLVGSLLRYLTHLIGATSVVEVGTGSGVSALWIFKGLSRNGVLTSIDSEAEHSKVTRTALDEAGIASTRYRLIVGNSREIISKLADSLYDIFIIREFDDLVESIHHAYRSLRPGGMLVIDYVLGGGKVPDPTQRDQQSIARREAIKSIKESEDWVPMLLPLGDGVMVATKIVH